MLSSAPRKPIAVPEMPKPAPPVATIAPFPKPPVPAHRDDTRMQEVERTWLDKAKELATHVMEQARDKLKEKYAQLEERYGPTQAKIIIASGLAGLPIPIPGSSLITAAPAVAIAETLRAFRKPTVKRLAWHKSILTERQIQELGRNFMAELLSDWRRHLATAQVSDWAARHEATTPTEAMNGPAIGLGEKTDSIKAQITIPYISQADNESCGVAAVAMVLHKLGIDKSQEKLKPDLRTDEDGTQIRAMLAVAAKYGLSAHATQMDLADVRYWIDRGQPVIAGIQSWGDPRGFAANRSGHYVVLNGSDDEWMYFVDSARGEGGQRRAALAEFMRNWHLLDGTERRQVGIVIRKPIGV